MRQTDIRKKIYEIRGHSVMLDFDLAELYEVETRVLNQAIKRNIDSFPKDFMFRLTQKEWQRMSSQFVMTSSSKRPKKALPYVFTEHGVTMLASVLKSKTARRMNILIVRAFVAIHRIVRMQRKILEELRVIKKKLGEHDIQLDEVHDTIRDLLSEKFTQIKWEDRNRIGHK